MLLLSGIGPKEQLEPLGVSVFVKNPAVGANLHDHVMAYLIYKTNATELSNERKLLKDCWNYWLAMSEFYFFGNGNSAFQMQTAQHSSIELNSGH